LLNRKIIESDSKYTIKEKNSKLIIHSVEQNDQDEYKCVAANRLGSAESLASHLKVKLEENGEVIDYEIIKDDDVNEQLEEVSDSESSDHFKSIYGITLLSEENRVLIYLKENLILIFLKLKTR